MMMSWRRLTVPPPPPPPPPPSSSILTLPLPSSSNFSKHQSSSPWLFSPPPLRLPFLCRSQQDQEQHHFVLHDALDTSGTDTTHARAARDGFCSQIQGLTEIERQTSICINRKVDLGKTALYIAAEDDSLVSHSSVPLPVDAFVQRLDHLTVGFCSHYTSSASKSTEIFLDTLDKYLYAYKGFRRAAATNPPESRALYLHSVLTHRYGSVIMLSLIYSEVLKMLRLWGILSFDVEIYYPTDLVSLPRGYLKQKSKVSDQPHILTTQSLLVEILRNLKHAFWPFRYETTGSLFLRAASAAKCISGPNVLEESAFERASAKAAQHRLERGIWTSVRFGDMRRALAACERLILLDHSLDELRDYSILLYHCGFYAESMEYLNMYLNLRKPEKERMSKLRHLEDDAVEELRIRLNLILMEDSWTRPAYFRKIFENNPEPW